jgi:hypothetical protein
MKTIMLLLIMLISFPSLSGTMPRPKKDKLRTVYVKRVKVNHYCHRPKLRAIVRF